MDLDGSELTVEIDITYACPADKALKFCKKIIARCRPEVCEKHFRSFHISFVLKFLHYRHSTEDDIEESMSEQCRSDDYDYRSRYPADPEYGPHLESLMETTE